jgi:hypothetical protein
MTDFDRDPAALAWARNHVQAYLDRLTDFEQRAHAKNDRITGYGCAVARELARRHFLGDGGLTVGAFDTRRANPPGNNGPSIAECAEADRRWPLEKAGE